VQDAARNPGVTQASPDADVIFRGKIIALRPSANPADLDGLVHNTGKTAVFQVYRVWKGEVGEAFEMAAVEETTLCWGFWPKLLREGTDLLVYASFFPTDTGKERVVVANICSRTWYAANNRDFGGVRAKLAR